MHAYNIVKIFGAHVQFCSKRVSHFFKANDSTNYVKLGLKIFITLEVPVYQNVALFHFSYGQLFVREPAFPKHANLCYLVN